ncbi:MAG: ATP-binding cassette domain-containing protein [Bacilli bacterium]|nr:ATP-binding cassette domain-containing protein [Bacilli bacterium]
MKKVLQNDIYDCGICSLKAILNYYHGDVPLEVLRYDTFTDCGGTDMYHLLSAARNYGLDGYGKKVMVEELHDLPMPLICHTVINNNYEHFQVIERIDNKHVYLMDPAKGNVKLKVDEFKKIFSGHVLVLTPISHLSIYQKRKSLTKIIIDLIINEKRLLINLSIITAIETLLTISYAYIFKIMLNENIIFTNHSFIKIALIFLGIMLFLIIFNFYKDYYRSYLGKNVDAFIKDLFIKHIFYLPSYSIKSRNPGEILTRLNELNNYKMLLTDYVVNLALDFITIFLTGSLLIIINHYLFLILIIMLLMYLSISLLVNKYIKKTIDDVLTKESTFSTNLIENITNLDSLKYLHLEASAYQKNEKINTDMLYANFNFELALHRINFIKNIIHELGLLIINLLGIYLIYHHRFTFIDLITFNTILIYFKEPIKNYIDLLPKISYIKSSFNKLSEFIQIEGESFTNQHIILDNGNVEFKNVSISYDGINNVLEHKNIIIPKNHKVLINGSSGTGKSSLCKALYRLNDNYEGNILINGNNIKDLDLNVIRSNIGYLGQKEGLFSDTIYNNIVMNRVVDETEFLRIAHLCMIDDILENKPLRYNTMLYEGGKNLSGGERQRILLARILLKYPDILILDEALSEVNPTLELTILNNLKSYLKNRTLIYISHRTINNYFDQVVDINES